MFSNLFIVMTTIVVAVNAWSSTYTSPTWSPTYTSPSSSPIPTTYESSTSTPYTTTTTSSAPYTSPSLTPCIIGCSSAAAVQDGCVSYTNTTCVCTNPQFQADAGYCIQQHCTPAELQAAIALQSAECAAVTLTPTGPSVTPSSVPYTYSGTSTVSTYSSSLPSGAYTSGGSTYYSSTSTSHTTTTSHSTTSTAAAYSLAPNGGVAAIVAMIFGFLAI